MKITSLILTTLFGIIIGASLGFFIINNNLEDQIPATLVGAASKPLQIYQGGTGTSTPFTKYPLVGNATSSISASSTIWVVGINATSTTASSTFQGLQTQSIDVQSTSATSTFANGLRFSGGSLQLLLTGCNGGTVLETDASGNLQCGDDSTGTAVFPFTPSAEGNATSTRILLNNGFISAASSTVVGNFSINGVLRASSTATSTLAGGLVIGTIDGLLKGVSGSIFPAVSGTDYEPTLTFGNMLTRSGNLISGSTTPTFSGLTSTSTLSVLGLSTFNGLLSTASSTFSSTLMTSGLLTANNGILSIASSTFSSNLDLSGGTVKQRLYPKFNYATSSWNGTTTRTFGAFVPETWNSAACKTNTGTVTVIFSDATNKMNAIIASTTRGQVLLTTNNSFTALESQQIDLGSVTGSAKEIDCVIDKTVN